MIIPKSSDERKIYIKASTIKISKTKHLENPSENNNLNKSHVTIETLDRKLTFNIINDQEFLDRKNFAATLTNLNKIDTEKLFSIYDHNKDNTENFYFSDKEKSIKNLKIDSLREEITNSIQESTNINVKLQNFYSDVVERNSNENLLRSALNTKNLGVQQDVNGENPNPNPNKIIFLTKNQDKEEEEDKNIYSMNSIEMDENETNKIFSYKNEIKTLQCEKLKSDQDSPNGNIVNAIKNPNAITSNQDQHQISRNIIHDITDLNDTSFRNFNIKKNPLHYIKDKSITSILDKSDQTIAIPHISKQSSILNSESIKNKSEYNTFSSKSDTYTTVSCFICDKYFSEENVLKTHKCQHTICRKCLKDFFEEKIEQGDTEFKCAMYKCKKRFKKGVIEKIISDKHLLSYMELKDDLGNGAIIKGKEVKLQNFENPLSFKKNPQISTKLTKAFTLSKENPEKISGNNNNYNSCNKNLIDLDSLKFYSQKHVLDVNTNESFYLLNRAREHICSKCNEAALYGKTSKYSVKCLNCLNTICKFCMKNFSFDHLDITSFNYCKVYFRRKLRKNSPESKSKIQNFLYYFLVFIVSFLLLLFASFKNISNFLQKVLCIKKIERKQIFLTIVKKSIYFLFLFLICSLVSCLFLICIIFFPPLLIIFR